MSDLCVLCKGSGGLYLPAHEFKYWDCLMCFGAGVHVQHGPAILAKGK